MSSTKLASSTGSASPNEPASSPTPLLHSRLTYLSISFVLLVTAFPMISYGTTQGLVWLWWLGFILLIVGGTIPPIYRVVSRRSTESAAHEHVVDVSVKPTDVPKSRQH